MLALNRIITACALLFLPLQAAAAQEIIAFHEGFDEIIAPDAEIKKLAEGFRWSEGPVWDQKRNRLYFTDVPDKKIYVWDKKNGLQIFLDPSGRADGTGEGANGLIISKTGALILPNHGTRKLEAMDIDTGERIALATKYMGKRFNSPNDVVETSRGEFLFTDPPYGLKGKNNDPEKEINFNGVYHLKKSGEVSLVDDRLTLPNGIVLSPDEETLYVAVSDPKRGAIFSYKRRADGSYGDRSFFFDAMPFFAQGLRGNMDGMAVSTAGHIMATGPGGVFVIAPHGAILGQIRLPDPTANVTFGPEGTLYITSNDKLYKVKTKLSGFGFDD